MFWDIQTFIAREGGMSVRTLKGGNTAVGKGSVVRGGGGRGAKETKTTHRNPYALPST